MRITGIPFTVFSGPVSDTTTTVICWSGKASATVVVKDGTNPEGSDVVEHEITELISEQIYRGQHGKQEIKHTAIEKRAAVSALNDELPGNRRWRDSIDFNARVLAKQQIKADELAALETRITNMFADRPQIIGKPTQGESRYSMDCRDVIQLFCAATIETINWDKLGAGWNDRLSVAHVAAVEIQRLRATA